MLGRESSTYKCAFRAWAQLVKTEVSVTMDPDVPVAYDVYDDYWHFYVKDNIYDSYTWYFNGGVVKVGDDSCDLDLSSNGVHLITLEVRKDGLYYSYSIQIKVKKAGGGAQC